MNKQIITFKADEQNLVKTGGTNCYASNIVSYIEAHFDLGENWSGYDSVRAVWSNDNNMSVVSTVLDSDGVCVVPFEVLKTKGAVMVNLVGSISASDVLTDRLTTFPCEAVKVARKAKINGSETTPITPSQFEQFVEAVISEVEKVTGMTAEAETLPAGSSATARYENGVLYLGIPQGIQGIQGEAGADGADGNGIAQVLYNSDYSITFVFTNGERFTTPSLRGETGPRGLPGPAGQDGRDGTDGRDGIDGTNGVTPSLSVGTVTTLPSTEDAYVTRRGTDENPVFDFGIPQGPQGEQGEVSYADLSSLLPTDTASGAIASFPDGQSVIPALSVLCEIDPIQDLHGYDKPWSEGAGKNKFDGTIESGALDPSNGQKIANSERYRSANFIKVQPNTAYALSVNGALQSANIYSYGSDKSFLSDVARPYASTFTTSADTHYIMFFGTSALNSDKVQLESGSAATSWTPYSNEGPISGHTECVTSISPTTSASDATTHTTSLGRTVYGGEVEVVGGSLTDKMGMVDMTSITDWNIDRNAKRIYKVLSYIKPNTSGATVPNLLSNRFEAITPNAIYADTQGVSVSTGSALQFHINGLTDNADVTLAEINQWFTDNPTTVCYELAQPQTYQLTPTEIALLKGTNNVWCDCGDTEVTYKADVGLYIDKKLNV